MYLDLSCGRIGVRASQHESIGLAACHGFQGVDPDEEFLATLGSPQLRAIRRRLDTLGLRWGAARLPVQFRRDEETFRRDLEKLPAIVGALASAGCDRIGTLIPCCSDEWPYADHFERTARRLHDVAGIAREHGVRLGLEYEGSAMLWKRQRYPFIHTLRQTLALAEAIDGERVGVVLDSWHWFTAAESFSDVAALHANQIVAVDVSDGTAGVGREQQQRMACVLPGTTGVIDLASFVGALRRIAYDGPIRAEVFDIRLRSMPGDQVVALAAVCMKRVMGLA